MFKSKLGLKLLLFSAVLFGCGGLAMATGTADVDISTVVDDATATFTVIKVACIAFLVFGIGWRLTKRFLKG